MAELFGIGLVALEIVQRRLQDLARLLVRTHDMHGVADRMHGLLEDENLVFLAELADQHQYLLARHPFLPFALRFISAPEIMPCILCAETPKGKARIRQVAAR